MGWKVYMKHFDEYLKAIAGKKPVFKAGASEDSIGKLEKKLKVELPADFKELYLKHDGEEENDALGIIFGLRLLSIDEILAETQNILPLNSDMTVMGTDAICEEQDEKIKWIPFAFDSGSCFIALDMTPSSKGKAGQIITLDMEYDECYLLADDIDDLFKKMTVWLKEKKIAISRDSEIHNFSYLDKLCTKTTDSGSPVDLPEGYWREYCQKKTGKACSEIDPQVLAAEKRMLIKNKQVDCVPFKYMTGLKELIFHDCELMNVTALSDLPEVTTLIFVRCTIKDGNVSVCAGLPKLKEIGVHEMSAAGLELLASIKTLKVLRIRNVTDLKEGVIATFTGIQELSVEKVNSGFKCDNIKLLKNLKVLKIEGIVPDDLDFLANLTKLTSFTSYSKSKNEQGLKCINDLKKLTEFVYPVSDITIYDGCEAISGIGVAPDVRGDFSVLKGCKVRSVMVIGKIGGPEMKNLMKKIEEYADIVSMGSVGI